MASNNPYHITTPYEVSSQLAGYQQDEQAAELGKLKVAETKRQLDEAALARNIKAEAVKGLQGNQEQGSTQAPMGLSPQAPMQPQAEPGSTAFWQGQNTVAPEQAPTTPVQQFKEAKKEYTNITKQMQEYSTISKALKDKGLVDQAEQYDTKLLDLETKAQSSKKTFLENTVKTLDLAGSLANGYIQAINENPANSNAAWARFAMQAKLYGADDENKLMMIPPEQRQQVAQQIMDQSEDGKTRSKLALESMKEAGKTQRFEETQKLKADLGYARLRQAARRDQGVQARWEVGQDQKVYKNAEGILNKTITAAQSDRRDIEAQIKALDFRINGLRSGTILTDSTGNKLTKEARVDELGSLQEQMASLNENRQSLTQEIDEHENHLKTLKSTFKEFGNAKPETEKVPDASVKATSAIETKFKADPQMKAYTLGKKEANGKYQVLDKSGKLIGHYE
jgi:hypothetical protein